MSKRINRKEFIGVSAAAIAGTSSIQPVQAAAKGNNPITVENAKAGTTAWQPSNQAQAREIEGYANKTSVAHGESISFYVNTASATYTIDIYRLGWYGGLGGRLYSSVAARAGIKQSIPVPNSTTGLCECKWKTPYTFTIPSGTSAWTSGIYLAKLTTKEGKQSHIPFVVRDDNRFVTYLFQSSVTTFQAYNAWGGKSLYDFNSTNGKRAYKVSFNRPYQGYGSGDLYNDWSGWELNTLRFLEREGYDVSYCTNIDNHANSNLFARCRSFLSVGHDEYWSMSQRNNVEYERNQGHHLAFLGANAAYWQVRFEKASDGVANRTMVCYKDATLDPYNAKADTQDFVTVQWRNGASDRPEVELVGVQFDFWPVNADMVVTNTNHWAFTGTGLVNGSILPGLVGYEADRVTERTPLNTVVLADSFVQTDTNQGYSNMTIYQHSSGAWVYATGSMQWAWSLDSLFAGQSHPNLVNASAQQIMRNVLDKFAI